MTAPEVRILGGNVEMNSGKKTSLTSPDSSLLKDDGVGHMHAEVSSGSQFNSDSVNSAYSLKD